MKGLTIALICAVFVLATACGDEEGGQVGQPTATLAQNELPTQERTAPSGDQGAGSLQNQWAFDEDPVGDPPSGSQVFSGTWVVREEADAPSPPNALCQTATAEFPALSLGDSVYSDVAISIRFKPISGEVDRAGGIIFRVQDADNYYIVRANALESNVGIYKYADGQRSLLAEGEADVISGEWQELRVEATGNVIRAFFSDQPVAQTEDSAYSEGRIGLWTKADSVTCFDSIEAEAR